MDQRQPPAEPNSVLILYEDGREELQLNKPVLADVLRRRGKPAWVDYDRYVGQAVLIWFDPMRQYTVKPHWRSLDGKTLPIKALIPGPAPEKKNGAECYEFL